MKLRNSQVRFLVICPIFMPETLLKLQISRFSSFFFRKMPHSGAEISAFNVLYRAVIISFTC